MTFSRIPLVVAPSQTLNVRLGNQSCRINVYRKSTGLYVDLYVSDVAIVVGVLALNLNYLVRSAYLGFGGDLIFYDTYGDTDPDYTGFDGRYVLLWVVD